MPIIGIPTVHQAKFDFPATQGSQQLQMMRYRSSGKLGYRLSEFGCQVALLPHPNDLPDYIDGLAIPGGADICPEEYGDTPDPKWCKHWDGERDTVELPLIRLALQRDIPVFGICRGHQALAVAAGGSLWQDIRVANDKTDLFHQMEDHRANTTHDAFGDIVQQDKLVINSLHHQCVRDVPDGFAVAAVASDGIVEAIISEEHRFALGVQYHPELMETQHALKVFATFIKACE